MTEFRLGKYIAVLQVFSKVTFFMLFATPFTPINHQCCSAIIQVDSLTQQSTCQTGLTSMYQAKLNHTVAVLKQKVSDGRRRGLSKLPAMGALCTWIGYICTGRVNSKLLSVSSSLKEDCWWV